MKSITIHPQNKKQLKALLTIFQEMKIPYESSGWQEEHDALEEEESPYDSEFVEEILQAKKDIEEGRGTAIKTKDLWK